MEYNSLKLLESVVFDTNQSFQERAVKLFQFHAEFNPVYANFVKALGIVPSHIKREDQIPLLPVRAFKHKQLFLSTDTPNVVFASSGTSGMQKSEHYIVNPELYKEAINREFYRFFQKDEFVIIAYMPGYNENPQSSLIWMMNHLIKNDLSGLSRFIEGPSELNQLLIEQVGNSGKKILLFGAAFGLMDMTEINRYNMPPGTQIVETGGMKTHRREISKTELRQQLSIRFGVPNTYIHSEYGMCELLSQMYAIGEEWFGTPEWVRVCIKKSENPLETCSIGNEGKIGIIDLANIFSCPFILTEDRGVMNQQGKFNVLGRWNKHNMRGCNFLIDRD